MIKTPCWRLQHVTMTAQLSQSQNSKVNSVSRNSETSHPYSIMTAPKCVVLKTGIPFGTGDKNQVWFRLGDAAAAPERFGFVCFCSFAFSYLSVLMPSRVKKATIIHYRVFCLFVLLFCFENFVLFI